MRRRFTTALLISCALAVVPRVASAVVPPTEKVIEAVEKWQKTLVGFEARYELAVVRPPDEPEEGRLTLYLGPPDKLRVSRELPSGPKDLIFAGTRTIVVEGGEATSGSRDAEPWAALFVSPNPSSLLRRWGVDLKQPHLDHVGPRVVWVLGGSPRDLEKPQIWVDRETGRPVRLSVRTQGRVTTVQMLGWDDEAAGGRVPKEIQILVAGRVVERLTLSQLKAPASHPADRFEPPPPRTPPPVPGLTPSPESPP